MNLFLKSCSAGDMILARFQKRLEAQLAHRDADFDRLLEDTENLTAQTRLELSEGRDRLLERSSCDPEVGQSLAVAIDDLENPAELAAFIEQLCAATGVDCEEHSDHTLILRPGEQEVLAVFPELPDDGLTVTTDRQRALEREDFLFLSWEHPWLEGAMETILGGTLGQACVGALQLKGVPAGSRLYEMLYTVSVSAPRWLELGRYLSLNPLRLLVDARGKDLSKLLPHEALGERIETLPRGTVGKVVRQLREEIEARADGAQVTAEEHLAQQRERAIAEYREHVASEIERMTALRAQNPAIREDELRHLEAQLAAGVEALENAQIKLQALRLVVTR